MYLPCKHFFHSCPTCLDFQIKLKIWKCQVMPTEMKSQVCSVAWPAVYTDCWTSVHWSNALQGGLFVGEEVRKDETPIPCIINSPALCLLAVSITVTVWPAGQQLQQRPLLGGWWECRLSNPTPDLQNQDLPSHTVPRRLCARYSSVGLWGNETLLLVSLLTLNARHLPFRR